MANLKQGMSGSEVEKLQNALIEKGYNVGGTGADGVFGKNTLAAVKQYQKDNGLTVDGIAGNNTLGSLFSTGSNTNGTSGNQNTNTGTPKTNTGTQSSNTGTQKTNTGSGGSTNTGNGSATGKDTFTTPAGNTYESFTYDEFTYDPFQGSDTLNQAWATLGQLQGNAPGDWTDPYKDQYMGYLNQYENRDPFSYDFNSDALYQQYKDQYIQQGQMAMMDTMGQAAAMTGGYGNSYAQTVGQQAYNQYLGQLNEIMPELYGMAYDRYNQEGQDLLNMYNAYLGLSEQDYNKYLGSVDKYYKELDAATNYANNLYNMEYGEWSDKTKMDFDTWSANTGLSFDEWAAKTGILSDENNTLMNQNFQAEENQKDRDFQSSENAKSQEFTASENEKDRQHTAAENEKNRAAAAANAAAKSPYGTLDTTDTMTWIKKFEGAEDLESLEDYTTALQGIIGPEAAAIWYDTYAKKFEDEEVVYPHNYKIYDPEAGGGGGGGTMYNAVR